MLIVSGFAVAGIFLILVALVGLAIYNLSAIIDHNQKRILALVSNGLGRSVAVDQIHANLGLGIAIEVDGLRVADDPAFSQLPFISANQVSMEVEFLPLIRYGRANVVKLDLIKPDIRILRTAGGKLNIATLGSSPAPRRSSHAKHWNALGELSDLSIDSLSIEDGKVYYSNAQVKAAPIQIQHVNLDLSNFTGFRPFTVELKFALLGDQQNGELSGRAGPILYQSVLDIARIPVDLNFKIGPMVIDQIRTVAAPGTIIPAELSMPDPLSASGVITGSVGDLAIDMRAALSTYRIVYTQASNEPAGSRITLDLSGQTEVRSTFKPLTSPGDEGAIAVALTKGGLKLEGSQLPAVSDLDGKIRLTPARLAIEPTSFTAGSSHAKLSASADSISPLKASFAIRTDTVKPSQFFPSRPAGERLNQLDITGTAQGQLSGPALNARISSSDGMFADLAYQKLDLNGQYVDHTIHTSPLNVRVFDGSLSANINATLQHNSRFEVGMRIRQVRLQQFWRWEHVDSSLRGWLSGEVRMAGGGRNWTQIKQGLHGTGRLALAEGKLTGINIVAIAINKIALAPVVSQVVSAPFRLSHRGLLADPDTELQQASLSFGLAGERITTHDLTIQSADYGITGDGWFDLNENISMTGDIRLTLGLSAAIPVVVMGQYPALIVVPNIPTLAERLAIGAVKTPVTLLKSGVKGLGEVFGGVKSLFH